jgi:hypothetical protein
MKFKHILLAVAVPALAFLSSCDEGNGGGGDVKKPAPTITFQTGTGFTSSDVSCRYDSLLKIGIRSTATEKNLTGVKVYISANGGPKGVILDTIIVNKNIFNMDYFYRVKGGAGDVQTVEVEATQENGESSRVSFKITIKLEARPLDQVGTQRVNNIIGAYEGAYDLNMGELRKSSDDEATKDLKDMTSISNPTFSKSWTSGNGSKFIRVTKGDWDNATSTESLYDLWVAKGAGATSTITNLAKDDYILVKTTQFVSFNVYLIRVDVVFETASNNNDYIEFTYRKESI